MRTLGGAFYSEAIIKSIGKHLSNLA